MNQLRRWQVEALSALEAQPKINQSVMAFTGSGKTRLALEMALRGRASGLWDHLLVVTPRDELRQHWVESGETLGLSLLPWVSTGFNSSHGAVTCPPMSG